MRHQILIGEVEYRADKGFMHGTHRTVAPEETLARVREVAPKVGLTRLADITGLDRIGIPTVVGYRPNAPTLAVSGGKGFTTAAAMVSAGMEAIEIWHAENIPCSVFYESFDTLSRADLTMARDSLPLTRHSLFDPSRPEPWVWGWDLLRERQVAVPCACVDMGGSGLPEGRRWMPFAAGSNGLAGGNHLLEAITAALLELAERDAVACCHMVDGGFGSRVDLGTVGDPLVRSLIDRFDAADVDAFLFDSTVDTQIPTYTALVADRLDASLGMYRGYGAHLDPSIAMVRALTEAAQSRLLLIAGSRDDYFSRDQKMNRLFSAKRHQGLESVPCTADANHHVNGATSSFECDLSVLLERFTAAGLQSVIVVDLTHPDIGIPVARVLVPGLEGYLFDHYQPGKRAVQHQVRMARRS